MERDSPLAGILLMIGFCIVAPLGDAVTKMVGSAVPLAQIVLMRFAIQALILWPMVRRQRYRFPLSRALWLRILLRTLVQIACRPPLLWNVSTQGSSVRRPGRPTLPRTRLTVGSTSRKRAMSNSGRAGSHAASPARTECPTRTRAE